MQDAQVIDGLELKFNALVGDLDERGPRRWAASEAMALGWGGITAVSLASDGKETIQETETSVDHCR